MAVIVLGVLGTLPRVASAVAYQGLTAIEDGEGSLAKIFE